MNKILLGVALLFTSAPGMAIADLPASFAAVMKVSKGPFGPNFQQGTTSRVLTSSGRTPTGMLFQAAYRNDLARGMVSEFGFYTGNLFTTNYYELMGEYIYGDAHGTHALDHAALSAKGPEAIAKAALMAQHWTLEKQYIELFPDSKLARSFKIRGISSYENEVEYANHFFNFYLGAMSADFQYLPAFLLATRSPLSDNNSLARARQLVATAYTDTLVILGSADPLTKALYKLRNSIHNQLSPAVLKEIDRFFLEYPRYRTLGVVVPADPNLPPLPDGKPQPPTVIAGDRDDLDLIRTILADYYAFNSRKLAKQADKVGLSDIKVAAEMIGTSGAKPDTLLNLSAIAANYRSQIVAGGSVPAEKRSQTLALQVNVSRFLKKELPKLGALKSPLVAEAAINAVYIEGFLITDNWNYFKTEIKRGAPISQTLSDVIDVASNGTLTEAFSVSLPQWQSIEPKMQYFVDNTIKSSALDTAAKIAEAGNK